MNEHAGFGVLRREDIAVDCNSPSLVHTQFGVTSHAIEHWGQLGAEQEDVNTAEARDIIERVDDGLLQNPGSQVADKRAVDIDRGAALTDGQI